MMHRPRLLLAAAALLASACTSTPPKHFYLLEAAPASALTAPASALTAPANALGTPATTAPLLGIGKITLPDYLNRPQIVVRDHGGRLRLHERDRWAEPLEDGLRRVLGENLGQLLGAGQVVQLPAPPGVAVDRRLHLEIIRFDASTTNEVWLHARWNIQNRLQGGQSAGPVHEQRIRIDANTADTATTVGAMNAAVRELSQKIVEHLGQIPAPNADLRPINKIPGN